MNAVRQVRTFGPPEGGTKDSLNVIYDCSYHPPDVQPVPSRMFNRHMSRMFSRRLNR